MHSDYNLVKESFTDLVPKKARVVNKFYALLLETAPELKILFSETNPNTQAEMLMGALSLAIKLEKDNFLDISYFIRLGERHRQYGFDLKYFDVFNDCLLTVLAESMGQKWSSEMRDQWAIVLQKLTQAMIKGMEG